MNLTKSLNPLVGAAALTAITVLISAPADAFQITATNNFFTNVSGATTLEFDGLATVGSPSASPINYTSGLATYTGTGRFVAGSIPNRFAQPPNNDPAYLTLGASQEPGPVTINFAKALDYFGLYWGSIDTYNSIAFFRGNTLLKGFGSQSGFTSISTIPLPGGGNQGAGGARYVNFFAENSGEWFDRIVLSSSQAAFESDNHAYRAVPTPAAVLPALLGMGAAAFRKKKQEDEGEVTMETSEARS